MAGIRSRSWVIEDVKAVLFDKDGTFVDSHVYWGEIIRRRSNALVRLFKLTHDKSHNIERAMGFDSLSQRLLPCGPIALYPRDVVIQVVVECLAENGVGTSSEIVGSVFNEVHKEFLMDIKKYIKIIPGSFDFIASLAKQNVKLAVVTTDVYENAIETLSILGLDNYFDIVVGKDTVIGNKDTGIPATYALKKLGIEPENAVCVGDAPMDIMMAKNSSCKAGIAVSTGQIQIDELLKITNYATDNLSSLEVLS